MFISHNASVYKLILFFWLICALSFSQQPLLKNYNVKDGLASSQVHCVFQDSKGFIWFGTDGGVSRFDGYTFKNYTPENGLVDNTVFGIQEDRHGRIWFRSLSGKLAYWKNDSVYSIPANDSISQAVKYNIMLSFYIDSGDTIWCGVRGGGKGYYKIAPPYASENFRIIQIPPNAIYLIEIEKGHYISGNTIARNLTRLYQLYISNKNTLEKIPGEFTIHQRYFFCHLENKNFLMADFNSLSLLKDNTPTVLLDIKSRFDYPPLFVRKSNKEYLMSIEKKGILEFKFDGKLLLEKHERVLDGFSVTDMMKDNEGGTWYSTLENGVYYAAPDNYALIESLKGETFMSRLNDTCVVLSSKKNYIDLVSNSTIIRNISLGDVNALKNLIKDSEELKCMSTGSRYHDGFFLLRGNKSFPVKDTLDRPVMSNSFATDQHQCFIATRSYLYKYSGKEGLFDHIITLPSRTNVLRLDSGILWLGCINGLWSYQDSRLHYHGHDNALLKSPIEDIYTAEDGTWYLATNGNGVIIKKGKQYFHFTTIDGLPSTSCKRFFSDNEKNVWVETKTGICELKQDRNHGFFVGRKKIYPEFFDESIKQIELIRDKLWIKTGSALLNCSWTDLLKPDVPPKIYLTGFLVNGVSMNSARRNFEHDQNFIRLSYVGLSFQNFGKLKYRYKLKGLEENWNVTENTSLQYPFLSPGNYEFIIKTIDLNGTESPEISLIKFSINKPFWQKAWFIILVGLIVFFCIVIIFYYRLNAFKKKERQKTLFNKQMADIEMKALRAQMNPHFLFNAINSIQNYILKKDAKTAQSYLSKFARLIRNVLESSEYEYITLKEETDHMALYMELEKLRSSNKFDYKISVDGSVNVEHVLIPPLLLQPYVENAILHGLLPLPGNNGILEFSLARKNDEIIITIEDNGIGRKKAAELKQKKELSHHSMGLKVSQERISILNVLHKTHTSWTFEDKYDAGGNAAGTKVTISMPIIFKSS